MFVHRADGWMHAGACAQGFGDSAGEVVIWDGLAMVKAMHDSSVLLGTLSANTLNSPTEVPCRPFSLPTSKDPITPQSKLPPKPTPTLKQLFPPPLSVASPLFATRP